MAAAHDHAHYYHHHHQPPSLCPRQCSSLPEVMSTIRPPPGKDWAKEMTSVYSHFYAGGAQDFSKAMALAKW